jgi:hypothetical protein
MRQHLLASSLLIALAAQVDAQPALDDVTPCSVSVRAFTSKDEEQMREVGKFMDQVFEQLDREHTKYGEPGIVGDQLANVLRMMAAGFCQQNPRSTISIEAAKAYRYTRNFRVRAGIEP